MSKDFGSIFDDEDEDQDPDGVEILPPLEKPVPLMQLHKEQGGAGQGLGIRDLADYGITSDGAGSLMLEPSLRKKQAFVVEFYERGDIGTAYQVIFDNTVSIDEARKRGHNLMMNDQFIRDLMTVARSRVETNMSGHLAEHVSNLAALRDLAARDRKWAPAIAAEVQRGKALGVYANIADDGSSTKEVTDEDMMTKVMERLMNLPAHDRANIIAMLQAPDK